MTRAQTNFRFLRRNEAEVDASGFEARWQLGRLPETARINVLFGRHTPESIDAFAAEWLSRVGGVLTQAAKKVFVTKRTLVARHAAIAPP